jgi:HEAT repeat protein
MQYANDGTLETIRVVAATMIGASPEEREAARRRAAEQREAVLARVSTPATPQPPPRGGPFADLDPSERFARVRELARQGGPDSLPALGEALGQDPDPALRRAAAAAIGNIGGPEAFGLLEGALGDDDASVRLQAIRGLRAADPATAVNAYGDVVRQDPDPAVRRAAVDLAASLGLEGAQVLELALDDDDERVRQAAERALQRLE